MPQLEIVIAYFGQSVLSPKTNHSVTTTEAMGGRVEGRIAGSRLLHYELDRIGSFVRNSSS